MTDALRERLEALLREHDEDRSRGGHPLDTALFLVQRLREALAAPADVPPLPDGWSTKHFKETAEEDGYTRYWHKVRGATTIVEVTDHGWVRQALPTPSAKDLTSILAHHLAKRP